MEIYVSRELSICPNGEELVQAVGAVSPEGGGVKGYEHMKTLLKNQPVPRFSQLLSASYLHDPRDWRMPCASSTEITRFLLATSSACKFHVSPTSTVGER